MKWVWYGTLPVRKRLKISRSSSWRAILSRASLSPATVTADGLLIAAIDIRCPMSSSVSGIDGLHEQLGAEADCEHASESGCALLQATSVVDHVDRLLEGEDTGQIVGSHFAGAVADDGVGVDATLLQLFSEGDLDGEVGGLCDLCFAHARTGFVGAKFVDQDQPCTGIARDRCAGCSR